jgi:hypothetical protein
MHDADRPAWFVGDLDDPWVAAIAERLPPTFRRRPCAEELPEHWIAEGPPPGVVVLHRPLLTALDGQRIARLRARGETPARVILCVGPHARHDDLVRHARLFDAVLPEATAAETVRRHVDAGRAIPGHRPAVTVVSGLFDIRGVLRDLCRHAGYKVETADDTPELAPRGLVVWDVPLLDPGWPALLARRAKTSAVLALLAFAGRSTVTLAREAGAAACLDWPCEVEDLAYALDGLAMSHVFLSESPHVLPPTPVLLRRGGRAGVVGPRRPD